MFTSMQQKQINVFLIANAVFFFITFVVFAIPAFATVFLCPNDYGKTDAVRWKKGLFGGTAQIKYSGKWVDFCTGGEFINETAVKEDGSVLIQSCTYGDESIEFQTELIDHTNSEDLYYSKTYQLIDFELLSVTHGYCFVKGEKVTSCNPTYEKSACTLME